jgi:tripartite-type tricarboxylate transporter receptor subunit TctC
MRSLKRMVLVVLVLAFVIGTMPGCTGAGSTASDIEFFNGKVVTIITPHGAGGGFDTYARMIAPYLQKYLTGSTVLVDNVTGAGGLQGRNKVFTAKPDGLTLGFSTGTGMLFAEWAEKEGVQYKMAEFSYLGRIYNEPHVMAVSAKKPYKSLDDVIKAKKITMGFSGVGSDDYYVAQIMAKAMGFTLEPITGYTGANEANLSAAKGEVDSIQSTYGSVATLITSGDIIPIVVYSNKRLKELPNVPTIEELAKGDALKLMQAVDSGFELDRFMFGPPNLPAARLKTLRDALDKAMADPEFISSSEKAKRPNTYVNGDEAVKLLGTLKALEPTLRPLIKEIGKTTN